MAWERAAFIRARVAAGDKALGSYFLDAIRPFVWRRGLDFGAIGEIRDLSRRIRDLSHGNRQKVGLVLAFAHDPELLVLDEPTQGLDPLMQQTFYALVEEARGRGATVFLSSHVMPEVERTCDRVAIVRDGLAQARTHGSAQVEAEHRTIVGNNISVRITLTWLAAERHFALFVHDLTTQRAVERTLHERNELLTRVLDAAAEGIYGVDATGRCTFINARALGMLGYTSDTALIGKDIHALIHHSDARGQPRKISEYAAYRGLLGRSAPFGTRDVFWRSDGTTLPVSYRCSPVLSNDGAAVVGAIVSFTDRSAELALRQNAERDRQLLCAVVDAVGEALILLNTESRIEMFNLGAQRVFGLTADEVLNCSIDTLLGTIDSKALIVQLCDSTKQDGGANVGPTTHLLDGRSKDGRIFPMRATFGVVKAAKGGWIALAIQDISDEIAAEAAKQRNEALEAQAQARRQFFSRISHELRTPLNAVLGFAQLLRHQSDSMTAKQQRAVGRIESAGEHMSRIVGDLMDLALLEQGGLRLDMRAFDIADEWPRAIALVLPMARARNINLRSPHYDGAQTVLWSECNDTPGDGSAWVMGDPMRVRQIIVNLLTNAIKYNRDQGAVTLEISTENNMVRIRVHDTGFGLSSDQLSRIGEPFNRLGAEQGNVEGSGLGLALSRNLALAMGGDLQIDSTLGAGTRASLLLRRTERQQPAACRASDVEVRNTAIAVKLPPVRLLHVDDDPVTIELVRSLIEHSRPDIDYSSVTSGVNALNWLGTQMPTLILTDMNLGDMTGFTLLEAIHRDARTASIPVLAMSGDTTPDTIAHARLAGFYDYLAKPVQFERLLNALDSAALAAVARAPKQDTITQAPTNDAVRR